MFGDDLEADGHPILCTPRHGQKEGGTARELERVIEYIPRKPCKGGNEITHEKEERFAVDERQPRAR